MPGCWTMQGTWDEPHYTNVQMPFPGGRPEIPDVNPTGVYERDFELPPAWAGKRVVLHVGAAESVLIVGLNGADVGIGKDSHLAPSSTSRAPRGRARTRCALRVVKWSDATYVEDQDQWWHGGITRSVFLYATGAVYLADVRAIAGLADDLTTGTLELTVEVGFAAAASAAGLDGRGDPRAARAWLSGPSLRARRSGPSADPANRSLMRGSPAEPATRRSTSRASRLGGAASAPRAPARRARSSWRSRVPDVAPWSAETAAALRPARRRSAIAGRRRSTRRRPSGSASGASRSAAWTCSSTAQRVFIRGVNRHDFDQHTGRVVTREPMRADLVPMKRFGFNAVRTSHYPNDPAFLDLTDELGLYVIDEADIESHAFQSTLCDDPRYLVAVGRAGVPDGAARQEPRLRHRLVAGQRVGLRRQPRGGRRLGPPATTRRRPLHYEGAIRFDWASDQGVSDITCPMYPPIGAIVDHARSGLPAPPADHVRVLARDGQQQRHARRVLGRHRVDARAPGRLHLGVVGPRPGPGRCPTARPAGPTAATSATSPTTATSAPTAWTGPTAAQARDVGAPRARRAGPDRRWKRGLAAGGSRSRTTSTSATSAGCGRLRR